MRSRHAPEVEIPAQPTWWETVMGHEVIVHQKAKGANSVRGIVTGVIDDGVELAHATLLGEDGPIGPRWPRPGSDEGPDLRGAGWTLVGGVDRLSVSTVASVTIELSPEQIHQIHLVIAQLGRSDSPEHPLEEAVRLLDQHGLDEASIAHLCSISSPEVRQILATL
jgi:hypothetical protein